MKSVAELPLWAALVVSALVLLGAGICLIGSVGLVRLRTFYQRVHAPTLGTTMGTAAIALGSIVCFTVLKSRPVLHELLIMLFVTVTTPVTLMLLARAALYRDRVEGGEEAPPARPPEGTKRS